MPIDYESIRREFNAMDHETARESIDHIIALYKDAEAAKARVAAFDFNVGDAVEFTAKHATWRGKVQQINRTTLTILAEKVNPAPWEAKDGKVRWRIHANSVRKVEEA